MSPARTSRLPLNWTARRLHPTATQADQAPQKRATKLSRIFTIHSSALKKSLGAITRENRFEPIDGPYAGPNTRLGLATLCIWHVADHYGQLVLYMRLNGIVPPASRPNPPELKD